MKKLLTFALLALAVGIAVGAASPVLAQLMTPEPVTIHVAVDGPIAFTTPGENIPALTGDTVELWGDLNQDDVYETLMDGAMIDAQTNWMLVPFVGYRGKAMVKIGGETPPPLPLAIACYCENGKCICWQQI